MAYTKNTWQTGDVVTAEKLNNMENGIAGASLVVNVDMTGTLDKTAKQIRDAAQSGVVSVVIPGGTAGSFSCLYFSLTAIMQNGEHEGEIMLSFYDPTNDTLYSFYAATENDYPVVDMGGGDGGGGGGISDVPVS